MSLGVTVLSRRALFAGAAAVSVIGGARAQGADDPARLVAIMDSYAAGLRSGNVEALVALYAANGVFMRDNMPAVVGRDALRQAYREVFATLKIDLRFAIQETEVWNDMAWLRATSSGRIKVLASGVESDDAFNLVVIFRREAGAWKIRNYIYASSRPGTGPAK
ncbi:MAG: nuclear transport factor 2 family protein [Rhodospirillales bacterium]|nr:nuclear transport factor 2 family protein [Rhodospirillales bacterium]